MVSVLFTVKHNRCALCGKRRKLHVLNLTRGTPPVLEAKPKNTHTGICMKCWYEIADVIRPRIKSYA